tara:strand:- start:484 stop:975 length:492 start_codon:yes stop_codon:yes gene_type:complete
MEEWKKIPGWERYSVSDQGRVRNDKTARVLRPFQGGKGRLKVGLYVDGGERNRLYVYRLVLMAFVGPCPDGQECCHNDGNHLNNRLDNIRWDNRSNNQRDRIKHGTDSRGERHGQAKLTEAQAYRIKFGNIPGTLTEVGAMFGVGSQTVSDIRAGKRWAWLKK